LELSEAKANVHVDDERLRITTWSFEGPGEPIGEHRHEFDYVVVPVTGGTFRVIDLDGSERRMEQVAGSPYLGTAGTEHDVVSASEGSSSFVEIELKR
jgi:quercetin dioxygenase-like cupin family protein